MSSGEFRYQAHAKCPFFRRAEQQRVQCEGIVDRSVISQTYQSQQDYRIQVETFCCNRYENCEVYRMLMEAKYSEEDEL